MQDEELKNARVFWKFGAFLFVLLIALDQLIKRTAKNEFLNYQFAFSLPLPHWLIYLIYALVLGGIIFYIFKNYRVFSNTTKVAWTLILAGAVSNISERIILGYVRDFIYITFYKWIGVYNLADGYIIAGIIILLMASQKPKE